MTDPSSVPGIPPTPIFLAGPTGGGKSAVALALADRFDRAAIVNADAFQIYRGIEILSAAPSERDRFQVPHHLYGVLSLAESCDAARYAGMARETIASLAREGIRPIVVGGSGLYLKALTHGLAQTPPGDPVLREHLETLSLDELITWYRRLDPEGAETADLKNRRYVSRYLEISLLSGKPSSEVKREFAVPDPQVRAFVLTRDREDLYARINHRTRVMFDSGAIDEVRRFENEPLSPTAAKAIGLGEIRELIAGRLTESEAVEAIRQATRRYAKRQGTWFRREKVFQSVCLGKDATAESAADQIRGAIDSSSSPS